MKIHDDLVVEKKSEKAHRSVNQTPNRNAGTTLANSANNLAPVDPLIKPQD